MIVIPPGLIGPLNQLPIVACLSLCQAFQPNLGLAIEILNNVPKGGEASPKALEGRVQDQALAERIAKEEGIAPERVSHTWTKQSDLSQTWSGSKLGSLVKLPIELATIEKDSVETKEYWLRYQCKRINPNHQPKSVAAQSMFFVANVAAMIFLSSPLGMAIGMASITIVAATTRVYLERRQDAQAHKAVMEDDNTSKGAKDFATGLRDTKKAAYLTYRNNPEKGCMVRLWRKACISSEGIDRSVYLTGALFQTAWALGSVALPTPVGHLMSKFTRWSGPVTNSIVAEVASLFCAVISTIVFTSLTSPAPGGS
jgi:hypothetical protein